MVQKHTLEKIVYNSQFSSSNHAWEFQAKAAVYIENELGPIIDEVCTELDQKGSIIKINKLVFDLGNFHYLKSEKEIKEKFREEIYNSLYKIISKLSYTSTEDGQIITKEVVENQLLKTFLDKGYFSSPTYNQSGFTLVKALKKNLNEDSKAFVLWLKNKARKETVRKRMVYQFEDEQLIEIIDHVDPENSEFIAEHSKALRYRHTVERLKNITESNFRILSWEVILSYLFSDAGSFFNRKAFIKYTLQKIATSYNTDFGRLLKTFSDSVAEIIKRTGISLEFPKVVSELKSEYENSKTVEPDEDNNSAVYKSKLLKQLKSVLQDGNNKLDSKGFSDLLNLYFKDTQKLIKQYLSNSPKPKNCLRAFTLEQLNLLEEKLDPKALPLLPKVISELKAEYEKSKTDDTNQDISSPAYKTKLLKQLKSVLQDGNNQFNGKGFSDLLNIYFKDTQKLIKQYLSNAPKPKNCLRAFTLEQLNLLAEKLDPKAFPLLAEVISELKSEYENGKTEGNREEEDSSTAYKTKLLKQLKSVLQDGKKQLDAKEFSDLFTLHFKDAVKLIKQYLSNSPKPESCLRTFTLEQLILLAEKLDPVEFPFYLFTMEKFDELIHSYTSTRLNDNKQKELWAKLVSSLTFSIKGQQLLKILIWELSIHISIGYLKLLKALKSLEKNEETTVSVPLRFLTLINQLIGDVGIDMQKIKLPDDSVARLVEVYHVYDLLLVKLFKEHKVHISKNELLLPTHELLSKLESNNPALLHNFLLLFEDHKKVDQILVNEDIRFISKLIILLYKNFGTDDTVKISQLQKFLLVSPPTKKEAGFYKNIIAKLIKSPDIALSEMSAKIQSGLKKEIALKSKKSRKLRELRINIFSFLTPKSSEDSKISVYEESWQVVLKQHPGSIFEIIGSVISNPDVFSSFIAGTNNELLVQIIETSPLSGYRKNFLLGFIHSFNLLSTSIYEDDRQSIWLMVFQSIVEKNSMKDIDFAQELLEASAHRLSGQSIQKKAIQALRESVQGLSSMEREKTLAVIHHVENKVAELSTTSKKPVKNKDSDFKIAIEFLQGKNHASNKQNQIIRDIYQLIKTNPDLALPAIMKSAQVKSNRLLWIKTLPEELLLRILFLIFPGEIYEYYSLISKSYLAASKIIRRQETITLSGFWYYSFEAVADYIISPNQKNFNSLFLERILEDVPSQNKKDFLQELYTDLYEQSKYSERDHYLKALSTVKKISEEIDEEGSIKQNINKQTNDTDSPNQEESLWEDEDDAIPIYIENAGLVLTMPSIHPLFTMFGLIEENEFIDESAQIRGIQMLQYLADGKTVTPEFELVLNKILCGVDLESPLPLEADLSEEEKGVIEQIIKDMIQNWKSINNTSVEGFRDSFLQRNGILKKREEWWELQVEEKPFDMLLDSIPWSYTTIKFAWMELPIYVKWRPEKEF